MFALYSRLSREGRVLATIAIISIMFSFDVGRTESFVLFAVLMALVTGSVLWARTMSAKGLSLKVSTPKRVSVGEDACFTVSITNQGSLVQQSLRLEGPFLPWDGRWILGHAGIDEIQPNDTKSITLKARFSARGEHELDSFDLGVLVPFGITQGTPVSATAGRFVIVPKLAKIAKITLPQARRYQPGGIAQASKVGDAMDLRGVRPYRPGDPVRDLHARTWARVGYPVVKEYQQEHFTRIAIVVDTDDSAALSTERFEAAVSLTAGITARLTRGEALIDLLVLGDKAISLTLGRSLGSLDQALDALATVEPGKPFSPGAVLAPLAPHMTSLSSCVLVLFSWDTQRKEVVRKIRNQGVSCLVLVLDGPEPTERDFRSVSTQSITAGEELSL